MGWMEERREWRYALCRDGKRVGCREEGCREVVEESMGVQAGVEEEGRCLSKTGRQRSGHWPDENTGMGCVMWSRRECKTGRGARDAFEVSSLGEPG